MKTLGSAATLVLIGLSLLAGNAGAQTETVLHSFGSYPSDGVNCTCWPVAGLVQGSDGNFYGTTLYGGTSTNCQNGCGTVFRINASSTYTTLYSFAGSPSDGANPHGALVQGNDGNFYGTTLEGGISNAGTFFRISPSGSYTTLYSFAAIGLTIPICEVGLAQGNDGNFYGTTYQGGANGYGSIFRISPSGTFTDIHDFSQSPKDGQWPEAGLVQGSDSNFYGTTSNGGTYNGGTVFRISPGGSYTNLYIFGSQPNDGGSPMATLVQGRDGNFYGTTLLGGSGSIATLAGTVFRISPSGIFTNIYDFGFPYTSRPDAGLVQGSDGNLYGATTVGSAVGYQGGGVVFRISSSGSYTSLYSFPGYANDGSVPSGGVIQGSDGNFYGTTGTGGIAGSGTVFRISVPLNPPANQISAVQPVGNDMAISVPSVAGETYQLQFSSSLTPTNWINVSGVSVSNSIGALMTLTNFGGALLPQGFYRFDITP